MNRENLLDARLFNALADVQAIADVLLANDNVYRPHGSLGKVPPTHITPRAFEPEASTFD